MLLACKQISTILNCFQFVRIAIQKRYRIRPTIDLKLSHSRRCLLHIYIFALWFSFSRMFNNVLVTTALTIGQEQIIKKNNRIFASRKVFETF